MDLDELEILDARQGFSDAQAALADTAIERLSGLYGCGWYGTNTSRERGSFGLVNRGGPLEELVGDRVKLTAGDYSVNVYLFGSEALDHDIHITRRAFAAVSLLAVDRIDVIVEVLSA
jgi:hypothetical protein